MQIRPSSASGGLHSMCSLASTINNIEKNSMDIAHGSPHFIPLLCFAADTAHVSANFSNIDLSEFIGSWCSTHSFWIRALTIRVAGGCAPERRRSKLILPLTRFFLSATGFCKYTRPTASDFAIAEELEAYDIPLPWVPRYMGLNRHFTLT
jgi:hypothetical protein